VQGRSWFDHVWYQELEAPLDSCWLLDAMIGEDEQPYAALALTRPRSARPFNVNDVKPLDRLRPWLAHAFRPASPASAEGQCAPAAGLPLLSSKLLPTACGKIVCQTLGIETLLMILERSAPAGPALPSKPNG